MYKIIGADGKEYGPVTLEQLRQWRDEGRLNNDTRVRGETETDWRRLADLSEFAAPPPPTFNAPPGFQNISTPPASINGFAIAGLVLGVISLPLCFCCMGLPFNLLGLIFSVIARSQIKQQPETYSGKGLALTGLICSIVSLVLGAIILAFSIVLNGLKFTGLE